MKAVTKFLNRSHAYQGKFSLSSDLNRPELKVDAEIKPNLDFAQAMLALREVVISNKISVKKDHSIYQKWVKNEYLKELELSESFKSSENLIKAKKKAEKELDLLYREIKNNPLSLSENDFYKARQKFWDWLLTNDKELWYVLDPVISVQPDAIIFEAFSRDESSYGRVTLPKNSLIKSKDYSIGTTNIDFSKDLADEFEKVRSYRPLKLKIGQDSVVTDSGLSQNIEKKIDLPQSWVNGFLEVQTASCLNKKNFNLTPDFVSDILAFLEQNKKNVSPKALKFILKNGELPKVQIEPWNKVLTEHNHIYKGPDFEVRLWGRERLTVLKDILQKSTNIEVSVLGDGMPSFWSCKVNDVTFDLCLSGWTANDWSSQLKFALMTANPKEIILDTPSINTQKVEQLLKTKIKINVKDAAKELELDEKQTLASLQKLCSEGLAMYDIHTNEFRWRELFNCGDKLVRKSQNKNLIKGLKIEDSDIKINSDSNNYLPNFKRESSSKKTFTNNKIFQVVVQNAEVFIEVDSKNNLINSECTCVEWKKTHKKFGPCKHIIAVMNKHLWSKNESR